MEQLNLYDLLYEKYKITKPIRLIELFSGYGSQALALKYLGVKFTHWRICEWATKSIQAYNDLHIRDYTDYSKELKQDAIIERLAAFGVSMDYNKPMTLEQIKRKGEAWQRQTYNNIKATHNLVDISKVKAKDLNIIDTDKYEYILTYSFPCQDLSLAGAGKGMSKESGTRSGLLWQVERILSQLDELPQVLVMENVPQINSQKNKSDFRLWQQRLEELGYTNNIKVLNAKDYCISQHRARCFMVSILGNQHFNYAKEMKLSNNLASMLEHNVDDSFFISNEKIKEILTPAQTEEIILKQVAQLKNNFESVGRVYDASGLAPTINTCGGGQREPKIMVIDDTQGFDGTRLYENIAPTLRAKRQGLKIFNMDSVLIIRKLTPKECWRLMGVKDADYNNVAANQSKSSLYHLAGDSIVTTVLMSIFGELLGVDYQTKITELVEELKECG